MGVQKHVGVTRCDILLTIASIRKGNVMLEWNKTKILLFLTLNRKEADMDNHLQHVLIDSLDAIKVTKGTQMKFSQICSASSNTE